MENQDKLFDLFKNASEKASHKDFPDMDKVWLRVEDKLDKKILNKKTKLWQKIAIAASVLLVVSIAYQYIKTVDKLEPQKQEIVVVDSMKTIIQENIQENKVATKETISPLIKKNAQKILEKQIEAPKSVAVVEEINPISDKISEIESTKENVESNAAVAYSKKKKFTSKGRFYNAIGVRSDVFDAEAIDVQKTEAKVIGKSPLVVIDGKAATQTSDVNLNKINSKDITSIVVLKEPLYIINDVYYTEEELFGEKPTSPYFPLDKQEIKTIKILQNEEAIDAYGEKGKKGVVIITTKTGKPAVPK